MEPETDLYVLDTNVIELTLVTSSETITRISHPILQRNGAQVNPKLFMGTQIGNVEGWTAIMKLKERASWPSSEDFQHVWFIIDHLKGETRYSALNKSAPETYENDEIHQLLSKKLDVDASKAQLMDWFATRGHETKPILQSLGNLESLRNKQFTEESPKIFHFILHRFVTKVKNEDVNRTLATKHTDGRYLQAPLTVRELPFSTIEIVRMRKHYQQNVLLWVFSFNQPPTTPVVRKQHQLSTCS